MKPAAMVMLGFAGPTLPEHFADWLTRRGLGGVFLFPPNGNYVDADQVRRLTDAIHACRREQPPLIAIDQEGGRVQAWQPPGGPSWPSARALGDEGPEKARETGAKIGKQLQELGVDVDFAPVLDVDTCASNPIIADRAFSADPDHVTACAEAFATGLHQNGVLACGKHFPGHGDTTRDSHVELPVVEADRDRLDSVELRPFRALVQAIPMLMTAHVVYPALDPDRAATHSVAIATRLLRDELGYDGVLISDDLAMKGIRRRAARDGENGTDSEIDLAEAAIESIVAGCDMVLSAFETDQHGDLLDAVANAVATGRISQERVEESAARIERLYQRRAALLAACA